MLNYKFDKKSNYLAAVTFAADSMALLGMMLESGVKPIVCTIDFKTSEQSERIASRLNEYIETYGLTFEAISIEDLPEKERYHEGEDYKEWARRTRYGFFKKIYDKYSASGLFLSHHQDDLLETYLLQKSRKLEAAHYGLGAVTEVDGMIVVRPLLSYTSEDLAEYCDEHRIPYDKGVDDYLREYSWSKERSEVSRLSEIERDQLVEEMKAANDETFGLAASLATELEKFDDELDIRALIALSKDDYAATVAKFLHLAQEPIDVTPAILADIRKLCLAPQPNLSLHLKGNVYVIKQYDILTLGTNPDELPYTYVLEKPGKLNVDAFDLDFTMGAEDRNIREEDYPLTIRTALSSDNYNLHGYLEPVHELFSSWKMPVRLRAIWPIFINRYGKIIYVPRYRMGFREYHTSILTIHLKNDEI